jgi:hypothetical protein
MAGKSYEDTSFRERLQAIRKARGSTQVQLAEAITTPMLGPLQNFPVICFKDETAPSDLTVLVTITNAGQSGS